FTNADDSPPSLRSIAYVLIGRKADGSRPKNGYWSSQAEREYWNRHITALEVLDPADRIQIFACLLPKIATHVETWWQYQLKLPFTIGYQRMAFRAPNQPHVYRTVRTAVLNQLIHTVGNYDQDLMWLAQYAPYINYGYAGDALGKVF